MQAAGVEFVGTDGVRLRRPSLSGSDEGAPSLGHRRCDGADRDRTPVQLVCPHCGAMIQRTLYYLRTYRVLWCEACGRQVWEGDAGFSILPDELEVLLAYRSQPDFAGRTCLTELRAPDVTAHHGQAAMPAVAHDLLIGHAVPISCGHEASPQSMRRDRLQARRL